MSHARNVCRLGCELLDDFAREYSAFVVTRDQLVAKQFPHCNLKQRHCLEKRYKNLLFVLQHLHIRFGQPRIAKNVFI